MLPLNKIRGLLKEREIKGTEIARAARVSPITVSVVLTGKGRSRNVQAVIAGMLGKTYEAVWGREKASRKAA